VGGFAAGETHGPSQGKSQNDSRVTDGAKQGFFASTTHVGVASKLVFYKGKDCVGDVCVTNVLTTHHMMTFHVFDVEKSPR
jgi:hypothetical protein